MKNKRNEMGITLIALVVTVIVLIILAGISITMLTGQNGILNRAKEAKEKTEIANDDEQRKLAQAEALMNTEITTYKGINLPEGFAPTKIKGEDSVNDGLVITDIQGNEFVWIEVPKTSSVYKTAGIDITNFSENDLTKIENDLHSYSSEYSHDNSNGDVYHEDDADGWFEDENSYNEAKQKMLKRIYENGGFWVGRYEAGSYENRTETTEKTTIPISKKNMYPYTWVTRTQAKTLAEKVEAGSFTSSLMYGIQWDLMLKYIETKSLENITDIKDKLKSNSTTIGNHCDSEIKLNAGKYAIMTNWGLEGNWNEYSLNKKDYIENKIKKAQDSGNGILMTTGASEETKLQNIYDISGNVWEWTLEYTKYNDDEEEKHPCAGRGGNLFNSGIQFPTNSLFRFVIDFKYSHVGFRVSIY